MSSLTIVSDSGCRSGLILVAYWIGLRPLAASVMLMMLEISGWVSIDLIFCMFWCLMANRRSCEVGMAEVDDVSGTSVAAAALRAEGLVLVTINSVAMDAGFNSAFVADAVARFGVEEVALLLIVAVRCFGGGMGTTAVVDADNLDSPLMLLCCCWCCCFFLL